MKYTLHARYIKTLFLDGLLDYVSSAAELAEPKHLRRDISRAYRRLCEHYEARDGEGAGEARGIWEIILLLLAVYQTCGARLSQEACDMLPAFIAGHPAALRFADPINPLPESLAELCRAEKEGEPGPDEIKEDRNPLLDLLRRENLMAYLPSLCRLGDFFKLRGEED